jgi:hypothetical protein
MIFLILRLQRVTKKMIALALLFLAAGVAAYDNNAPGARLPTLGWSSWIGLGPNGQHPVFDYCDEASVRAAADAFVEIGLYEAGYRHFVSQGRPAATLEHPHCWH